MTRLLGLSARLLEISGSMRTTCSKCLAQTFAERRPAILKKTISAHATPLERVGAHIPPTANDRSPLDLLRSPWSPKILRLGSGAQVCSFSNEEKPYRKTEQQRPNEDVHGCQTMPTASINIAVDAPNGAGERPGRSEEACGIS